MNKADIVKSLSIHTSLPEITCRKVLDALMVTMEEGLSKGDGIVLQGFGTFRPWQQCSRPGRNPRNGEACLIAPRISVRFKAGKNLLKVMNNH